MIRLGSILAVIGSLASCGGDTPTRPSQAGDRVLLRYQASTQPRTDLPPSAAPCVTAVGETHVHVTWRNPDYVPLRAVGAERWEAALNDAPAGQRLTLLIHDGNVCDVRATGAATQNVYVNDVLLVQSAAVNTTSGAEPGLAFSVDASGRVTP